MATRRANARGARDTANAHGARMATRANTGITAARKQTARQTTRRTRVVIRAVDAWRNAGQNARQLHAH
eukprot:9126940-Lingulodinium_polyedra.AAC.1